MGRGAHYPPGAGSGVVNGDFDRLACLQFLGILDLVQLLNLFHTDSVLLRNLSQCFAFCQTCVLTIRTRAAGAGVDVGSAAFAKHLQSKRQLQLVSLTLGRNRRIGSARKPFLKMEFDLRMVHRRDQRVGKVIGRYVLMPSV